MSVVTFPKQFQHQLPPDAIPSGKDRHAWIFPFEGAWAIMECDDGGGSFKGDLTKRQALMIGLELVVDYSGTLEVLNKPLYGDGDAA